MWGLCFRGEARGDLLVNALPRALTVPCLRSPLGGAALSKWPGHVHGRQGYCWSFLLLSWAVLTAGP